MNSATLVAIVKDELPYLIEWVAYHRVIGFDRIAVYSNDCSDGTEELLDRMREAGLVEHIKWPSTPGQSAQKRAYLHARDRCSTDWIMSLDADEFLNLHRHESVADYLAMFDPSVSAIAINWRVFGSGGQAFRGPQPVIKRFTRASTATFHLNRHVKTIFRPADAALIGVHGVELARGSYAQSDGQPCALHRHAFLPPVIGYAQVNHYVVRSRQEYEEKLLRGNANLPPEHPEKSGRAPDFFEAHDRNEESDSSILRHLPALRHEMRRIEAMIG